MNFPTWLALALTVVGGTAAAQEAKQDPVKEEKPAPAETQQDPLKDEKPAPAADTPPAVPPAVDLPVKPTLEAQEPAALQDQEGPKIKVTQFTVTGAESLSEETIRAILAPHEGTEMDLKSIRGVGAKITQAYRDRGYFLALAFVPLQDVKEGVVQIVCVEGKADKVKLEAAPKHYSVELLREYTDNLQGRPRLDQKDIERVLLNLNDLPQLKVRGTLSPGEGAGNSILNMSVKEQFPFWASLNYDNFGSRAISEHRLGATMGLANLWDEGHWVTFRTQVGFPLENLQVFRGSYHVPIGSDGFVLAGAYTNVDYEADGPLNVLDPTGSGHMADLWVSYPFIKTSDFKLGFDAGFEFKDLEQKLLDVTLSNDILSILRIGLNAELVDDWNGRNIASLGARQGIADLFGALDTEDVDSSRLGSGGSFSSLQFSFHRIQKVTDWLFLVGRFGAQYVQSNDPLVVSEMYGIGGHDSVRGYPSYEFTGDRGFNWGFEARVRPAFLDDVADPIDETSGYHLSDMLQFVLFYDRAEAERVNPFLGEVDSQVLDGWGTGLRVGYPEWVNIRYDIGWPIGGPTASTGDRPEHYVSLEVNFKF